MTQNSIEQYNTNSSKVLKSRKYFHLNECVWCVITLHSALWVLVFYISVLYFLFFLPSLSLRGKGKKKITWNSPWNYKKSWTQLKKNFNN